MWFYLPNPLRTCNSFWVSVDPSKFTFCFVKHWVLVNCPCKSQRPDSRALLHSRHHSHLMKSDEQPILRNHWHEESWSSRSSLAFLPVDAIICPSTMRQCGSTIRCFSRGVVYDSSASATWCTKQVLVHVTVSLFPLRFFQRQSESSTASHIAFVACAWLKFPLVMW